MSEDRKALAVAAKKRALESLEREDLLVAGDACEEVGWTESAQEMRDAVVALDDLDRYGLKATRTLLRRLGPAMKIASTALVHRGTVRGPDGKPCVRCVVDYVAFRVRGDAVRLVGIVVFRATGVDIGRDRLKDVVLARGTFRDPCPELARRWRWSNPPSLGWACDAHALEDDELTEARLEEEIRRIA